MRRQYVERLVVKREAGTEAHRGLAAVIDGPRGRIQPFVQGAETRHRAADSRIERVTVVNALHAIAIWSTPVPTPQPSSITPLQLSSIALKQSSGPVGVHACTSVVPCGGVRFVACTLVPGAFAGAEGPHANKDASRMTRLTLPPPCLRGGGPGGWGLTSEGG